MLPFRGVLFDASSYLNLADLSLVSASVIGKEFQKQTLVAVFPIADEVEEISVQDAVPSSASVL